MMNSNEKKKKHRIDDIKVRNGFQWCEQHIYINRFCSICLC
jgi:hypothetical protein